MSVRMHAVLLLLSFLVANLVILPSQAQDTIVGPQRTWVKNYGGFDLDIFWSIQQTPDGGFIVAGEFGTWGTWVLKLDQGGSVVWQNTYGGGLCGGPLNGKPLARQTRDGGFLVVTGQGPCLLKLDPMGNPVWLKAYVFPGNNYALSLDITPDGGSVISGWTFYPAAASPDAFALRLDGTGNVLWQRTYSGTGWDVLISIQPTSDGGFIGAGETTSFGAGDFDAWIVKLDESGEVTWQTAYGGPRTDRANSVSQISEGGFIAAGTTQLDAVTYDAWILRLDPLGNVIWQKKYGFGQLDSVLQTLGGAFVAAGSLGSDAGFLKVDDTGKVLWARTYGGTDDDWISSLAQTSDGGFVAAGFTRSFAPLSEPDEPWGDGWVLRMDGQGRVNGQCHQVGPHAIESSDTDVQINTTAIVSGSNVTTASHQSTTTVSPPSMFGSQCVVQTHRP